MFERYSEPARFALFQARLQAAQEASDHISIRHLVLGAIKAGPIELTALVGAEALAAIQDELRVPEPARSEWSDPSVEIPFDKGVRMILVRAPRERRGDEVTIEDLLRVALTVDRGPAAEALRRAGLASKL